MSTKAVGDAGERLAADWLVQQGYRISARQYRHERAELDLVCEAPDGTVVFVEVKLRRSTRFGRPEEAVTPAKQRHLVRAAEAWLHEHACLNVACRFDVIAIVQRPGQTPIIEHFEHAFEAGGSFW